MDIHLSSVSSFFLSVLVNGGLDLLAKLSILIYLLLSLGLLLIQLHLHLLHLVAEVRCKELSLLTLLIKHLLMFQIQLTVLF